MCTARQPVKPLQGQDPAGRFGRQWLPELGRVDECWIHTPWQMDEDTQCNCGCVIGRDYAPPIVYRASKAALNMCLKTLAIEWRRIMPNVAVAALHPGTTDTALSKPFLTPAQRANYLLHVLDGLKPEQSGQFMAFDGERLPW